MMGLLELIGNARFVLLGEATHGTHEFYSERGPITKQLIAENSSFVLAIEADWPDSARVHRYVHDVAADADASEALAGFRSFPISMWRNYEDKFGRARPVRAGLAFGAPNRTNDSL